MDSKSVILGSLITCVCLIGFSIQTELDGCTLAIAFKLVLPMMNL